MPRYLDQETLVEGMIDILRGIFSAEFSHGNEVYFKAEEEIFGWSVLFRSNKLSGRLRI
jgi:hypothetical protein